jgi:hypothetical protein
VRHETVAASKKKEFPFIISQLSLQEQLRKPGGSIDDK